MGSISPLARARRVHYPESDGKPFGETDQHRAAAEAELARLRSQLEKKGE